MRHVGTLVALIALALPGLADEKSAPVTTNGRIIAVARDDNRLTVLTGKGEVLKLQVAPDAKLEMNDRKATFAQFRIGDPVRVRYEAGPTGNRATALTSNATTARELGREVREALQAAGSYAYREKEQFRRRMGVALQDLDARIENLRARASERTGEARERLRQEIKKLESRRKAIGKELAEAGSATADAWDNLKKGVSKAVRELGDAVEKATEPDR